MSSTRDILPEAAAELARQGKAAELSALLKDGLEVNLRDAKGNTLLMLASYHGKTETVVMLLKARATVDLRNDKGQTPLGGVAFKGYVEIATLLLDAGADPVADQGGSTPADFATLAGKTEILALLQARRDNAAKPTRWFSKLIGWVRR
jgi:ankyrin repeat protein